MLRLRWLKRPKTVPIKRNLHEKINYLKPHILSLSINPLNLVVLPGLFKYVGPFTGR